MTALEQTSIALENPEREADNKNMEATNTTERVFMFYVRITHESDRHALPMVDGRVRLTFGPYESPASAQQAASDLRHCGFHAIVAPVATAADLDNFIINEIMPAEAQMIGESRAGTQ